MTNKIRSQILTVRDDGSTNMFDVNGVMDVANQLGLYELVVYLMEKDNRKEYSRFIMTGEAEIEDEAEEPENEQDEDYSDKLMELIHSMTIEPRSNWFVGTIGDCSFEVKVTEEDSQWGINNGRIIKLFILAPNGDEMVSYERGWDIYPENNPEYETLIDALSEYFANRMDKEGSDATREHDG